MIFSTRQLSLFACTSLLFCHATTHAKPMEVHARLAPQARAENKVALTLDACSGRFDEDLLAFLIRKRIPATIFVTKKWLDKNPRGVTVIKSNLDLFAVEDHGEKHIPAIIGSGRTVYGLAGEPDIAHLQREVTEGAKAITSTIGIAPQWYRGASAKYDAEAITEINRLGYKIAGFSFNADHGATLRKKAIVDKFKRLQPGDVIIAHMNKPQSDSAQGLSSGLNDALKQGFVFVRLDQVEMQKMPDQKTKRDKS
ncbi:polysaccharide deacetylase family protein [Undibacterium sp. CY18W]|uniref:Polysaccharide deacetylase family protein n=1 Tax=Undibacterium hunanense TaxID=2762292 RepID=A0ABR6ZUD8_9BURK|nr:polysaccharide deacetylase family protein [Undibacterium hunanense]MBC3919125.1 polysaccharide deacetylase family protein [Undibacterium hunanense]